MKHALAIPASSPCAKSTPPSNFSPAFVNSSYYPAEQMKAWKVSQGVGKTHETAMSKPPLPWQHGCMVRLRWRSQK